MSTVGLVAASLIAIVDDDPAVCVAISSLVRSAGYECATFGSAESFLAFAGELRIDCVLLDIRLPGMSGLDLHQEMGRSGCRPPVIYVTATDGASRDRALSNGAVAFLTKPFDEESLLTAIRCALSGSGPANLGASR